MQQLRFVLVLLGTSLFFAPPLQSKSEDEGASSPSKSEKERLFGRIRAAHSKIYPEHFAVEVHSKLLESQLALLPKEAVVFGKKPTVRLLFRKGRALRLKVFNVEPYYTNLFSVYESMLGQTGVFFGVDNVDTYKAFASNYDLKWNDKTRSVRVWEREGLEGDYGVFFLDKSYAVARAAYVENGEKVAELRLVRQPKKHKKKKLNLVKRLSMRLLNGEERTEFVVSLTNYNFAPLPDEAFD